MSTFRKSLLTSVSALCEQLFSHRLQQVREQQLVSDKAKKDLTNLVLFYDQLCFLEPFPTKSSVYTAPLDQLKADITATDNNPDEIEAALLNWVRGVTNAPDPNPMSEKEAAALEIPEINKRMLDTTARLRSTIDKVRPTLRGQYDFAEYKAARNSFTLAREAYDHRLQNGSITATVTEVTEAEGPLYRAINEATGASFPGAIQGAANFMKALIFVVS